ncbi:MAG: MSMEG_0567/Sll0786 family nitrogen starvation N-acetyltransferase [Oryzihumus sp.]
MTAADASATRPGRATGVRPAHAAPSPVVCREAGSPGDLVAHFAVRHEVFVVEQAVFARSDRDERDARSSTVHVVGCCDGVVVGSVRLYELDARTGLWQGDRLAVLAPFRVHGLGAPLVRCAVALAGARGGRAMVAHIQLPNVAFFTRLGWEPVGGPETYVGLPHQQMRVALPSPERGASLARALAEGTDA